MASAGGSLAGIGSVFCRPTQQVRCAARAVVPAERVPRIRPAPAEQFRVRHAIAPCMTAPCGSSHTASTATLSAATAALKIRIGRVDGNPPGDGAAMEFGGVKYLRQVGRPVHRRRRRIGGQ